MDSYKYITENNLEDKQDYMYSEFGGSEFLKLYRRTRKDFLKQVEGAAKGNHDTRRELDIISQKLQTEEFVHVKDVVNQYVKRFEVSKRVYTEYDSDWKPTPNASYERIDLYILLARCCLEAYKESECTKYYSCLLKVDDTLLSVVGKMTESERKDFAEVVQSELEVFDSLAKKKGVMQA